jgi:hypothetical protein
VGELDGGPGDNGNRGTSLRERQGDELTDAPTGTCDQGHRILQTAVIEANPVTRRCHGAVDNSVVAVHGDGHRLILSPGQLEAGRLQSSWRAWAGPS